MAATVKKRSTKKKAQAQRAFINRFTGWVIVFAALCLVFLAMVLIAYR